LITSPEDETLRTSRRRRRGR